MVIYVETCGYRNRQRTIFKTKITSILSVILWANPLSLGTTTPITKPPKIAWTPIVCVEGIFINLLGQIQVCCESRALVRLAYLGCPGGDKQQDENHYHYFMFHWFPCVCPSRWFKKPMSGTYSFLSTRNIVTYLAKKVSKGRTIVIITITYPTRHKNVYKAVRDPSDLATDTTTASIIQALRISKYIRLNTIR